MPRPTGEAAVVEIRLTIANYRCFGDDHPAEFRLLPGVIGIVGANNAGKSALLRFFWEFRPLFGQLAENRPYLIQAAGSLQGFD